MDWARAMERGPSFGFGLALLIHDEMETSVENCRRKTTASRTDRLNLPHGMARNAEGITTSSAEKKEIPEGAWYKCPNCKTVVSNQDHANNLWVCAMCDHHERIGSNEYFGILFDDGKYREVAPKLQAADPLSFEDTKAYTID